MDLSILKSLIAQGESACLEFKTSWSGLEDACKTLCAFLNTKGGSVLIGVKSDGTIRGVLYDDEIQQTVARHLKKFDPAASLKIEQTAISEHNFVVALIAPISYSKTLYQYDGRVYERVGSTKQVMPIAKQQALLLERMEQGGYEGLPTALTVQQLDSELIQAVIKRGIATKRVDQSADSESVEDLLQERLGLMLNGHLCNAAVILFGKSLAHYPQCTLKLIAYRGLAENDHQILDNVHLCGNIFKLLTEAQAFVGRFTAVKTTFNKDQFERIDTPQIPPLALREILVNALIHRDYSEPSGFMSIKIFSDRAEIWNAGLLPSEVPLEALKKTHLSRLRNPRIARILYYNYLVESWGKGTNRVLQLCFENHTPEPQFEEADSGLKVTFYFEPIERLIAIERDSLEGSSLHPRDAILALFKPEQPLSLRQIKAMLNLDLPDRTLRRYLGQLRAKGLLLLHGRSQNAVWLLDGSFKDSKD